MAHYWLIIDSKNIICVSIGIKGQHTTNVAEMNMKKGHTLKKESVPIFLPE